MVRKLYIVRLIIQQDLLYLKVKHLILNNSKDNKDYMYKKHATIREVGLYYIVRLTVF